MNRLIPFFTFLCLLSFFIVAQDVSTTSVSLKYNTSAAYYFVERSNWSTYVNGKYSGLTHRENRAQISCIGESKEGIRFSGHFYILEETLRDMTHSARAIDEIKEAAFSIASSGDMIFNVDNGYPQLRSFPVYPDTPVNIGDKWQSPATRIIDPRNDGKKSSLPIEVEYEFIGAEIYNGVNVFRIKAQYATRLNKYLRKKTDDPNLTNASGVHKVDILVDADSGAAILILDHLDETFFYQDGSSIRYKGNTALFTELPVPVQRTALIPKIQDILKKIPAEETVQNIPNDDLFGEKPITPPTVTKTEKKDIDSQNDKNTAPFTIEETPQGIRLSIRDIRFLPDSDSILPEEQWRLDAIAQTLSLVNNGRFLIEGHTAAVGKSLGEKELSLKRAKKIAEELAKRGLQSEQFIYTGQGGIYPVADNGTAEGRAQNRRVEITILE